MHGITLGLTLVLALPAAAAGNDLEIFQQQTLTSTASSGVGQALAVDGTTLVVSTGQGVDVYEHSAGTWTFAQRLVGSQVTPGDFFGVSVAIDGDRLAAGASWDELGTGQPQGRVYVFERSAGTWSETATLDSGELPNDQDGFGNAVAVEGDRIVVGDSAGDGAVNGTGAVFVFDLVGGAWSLSQKLLASNGSALDRFGAAVDVEGDRLVVGAPRLGADGSGFVPGAAYAFERIGGVWTEVAFLPSPLTGSVLTSPEGMGVRIALDGDRFVAGAYETGVTGAGVVYERVGGTWQLEQILVPNMVKGWAGYAVDIEGDAILLGTLFASDGGALSLWHRQNDGWSERRTYRVAGADPSDRLGAAVALDEGRVFGSAQLADGAATNSGVVYTFPDVPALFGEVFCFGDGSGTNCPCSWNTFMLHGPGCQNSTAGGGAALLVGTGSPSVSADDLRFTARGLVPSATALLFWRGLPKNGGLGVPFGNGLLCIGGGGGGRLGVRQGHPGDASWGPGFAASEGFLAGQTAYFQVWYRDQAAFCGQGTNMTNGFEVLFQP